MTPRRDHALAGVLTIGLGASIAPLDFAVNVAFPAISAAFALEVGAIRWLVICYVVTYASLMLAFGKLGDIAGHRRVFRAGLIVGTLAFAACGMAPGYGWLIAARVAQGIATALVLSCAPALVVSFCAEARRTWALSRYAMTTALAGIAGPVVGGLSIEVLGWAGVFWFRVPVALLTLVLLARLPAAQASEGPARRLDLRSSLLLTAGLALLLTAPALWFRADVAVAALEAMVPPGAMLAGAALLIAFVWRERGHPEPILPRVVLRNPLVLLSNLDSVMINLAGFAIPLLVPYYLARVGGFGAPAIGVLLAMSTLGVLATSTLAPRLIHALGQRRVAWLGMSVAALGQFAVALWPAAPALPMLCMALLLHGAGFGLFQVSYTDHIIAALPKMDRGVAGSLTILTRTVGVVVSAAVLSSALQSLEAYHLAAGMAPVAAFHAAFAAVFRYTALLLAGYVVLSSVLSAMVRRRSGDVVG